MTVKIQKMIYDELRAKIEGYPVYTCPNDSLRLPYILINTITISKLPFSQESNRYEEVDVTISIYHQPHSNKSCLDAMDQVKAILENLSNKFNYISNLSITSETQHNKNYFSANLQLNFYCIS